MTARDLTMAAAGALLIAGVWFAATQVVRRAEFAAAMNQASAAIQQLDKRVKALEPVNQHRR